jgi:hypothetical protein
MGDEIKSTIELAMEKTKDMVLSSDEAEEMRLKELREKAQGLANRYLAGDVSVGEIKENVEGFEEKSRSLFRGQVALSLVDALNLDTENERSMQALVFLAGEKDLKGPLSEVNTLVARYRHAVAGETEELELTLKEELKRVGISGSAVKPKVKGSLKYKEASEKARKDCELKLSELKQRMEGMLRS